MGFQDLPPKRRREISSQGGRAAHNRHRFTVEEARKAGRKGGLASARRRAELAEGTMNPANVSDAEE